jgi:hypothetical protein
VEDDDWLDVDEPVDEVPELVAEVAPVEEVELEEVCDALAVWA